MKLLLEAARDIVRGSGRCALALILSSSGSTPRGEGAGMLVLEDGATLGTIGGGAAEWSAACQAREALAEGLTRVIRFDMAGGDTAAEDAICGGTTRVCLHPLGGEDLPALTALCDALEKRERAELVLWMEKEACRLFCVSGGVKVTGRQVTEELELEVLRACQAGDIHEDERLLYHEILSNSNRLWIMGGGHVAQATAQVAAVAGFDLTVVDDRVEFASAERFPGAECVVCQEYDELPREAVAASDYIVVVTRGHRNDREALRWALETKACYVGMIGSRAKRDLVYQTLEAQGVPRERLEWVHSPIGLPIGGRTPGDIAVSIVAELISVRSELTKGKERCHGKE